LSVRNVHVANNPVRTQVYAPQTKILEGRTKEEIRLFEALFNGS
jgi:hypothetical protein